MNTWLVLISVSTILLLSTDPSYAGAALYKVQQMKEQKAREEQRQYQMLYQQQQQQAASQEQRPSPNTPPQTYEQVVEQRNQALAQAVLHAHNSPINQVQQKETSFVAGQQGPMMPTTSQSSQETVDLAEVWKKLDKRSKVWTILIDEKDKVLTVSEYIDRFRKQGVRINQTPIQYVQMIDQVATGNPDMLEKPFGELLQILAIIDYDFDNGMDKDSLARAVLGQAYDSNKRRFSQQ